MIEVEVEVEIESGIRNSIPGVVLLSFQRISPLNLIQRLPSLLQSTTMHILFLPFILCIKYFPSMATDGDSYQSRWT